MPKVWHHRSKLLQAGQVLPHQTHSSVVHIKTSSAERNDAHPFGRVAKCTASCSKICSHFGSSTNRHFYAPKLCAEMSLDVEGLRVLLNRTQRLRPTPQTAPHHHPLCSGADPRWRTWGRWKSRKFAKVGNGQVRLQQLKGTLTVMEVTGTPEFKDLDGWVTKYFSQYSLRSTAGHILSDLTDLPLSPTVANSHECIFRVIQ